METTRLGRTGLEVTRTGFGALPIQRCGMDEAVRILRRAFEAGITFYDTARAYSDSEEKLGAAFADVRDRIVIATKTHARTRDEARRHLDESLAKLRTDRIDVWQLHNPDAMPDPDDAEIAYAALLEAKEEGVVGHIGVTSHRLALAKEEVRSGLFETMQFPLSALSSPEELALVDLCRAEDVGLIAMKALCGGIFTDARAAFAALRRFENVVPIWGIQRMDELEAFVRYDADPPAWDAEMEAHVAEERAALGESFCRGCGYCLPCPAEIPIPMACRMKYLLRRAPTENFLTDDWREKMERIEQCTECGVCHERCPYGLEPYRLLPEMLADYRRVVAAGGATD